MNSHIQKFNEKTSKNNLITNILKYKKNIFNNSVLYNNNYQDSKGSISFINYKFDHESDQLKKLIDNQVLLLENYSKELGNDFLELLMNYIECDSNSIFKFNEKVFNDVLRKYLDSFEKQIKYPNKEDYHNLIKNIDSENIKEIITKVFINSDFEDKIYVEKHNSVETIIKRSNNLFFDIEFDIDFLCNQEKWEAIDYRYIIIDGYIDKVSEIHHLLHEASESKDPYVIFCKGMHEEVKKTIIYNNLRKTINVFPISFSTNEESVNILNDIASCHDGNIISSYKGDVISVEVRKELQIGNKITINKKGFYIECLNQKRKERQLKYIDTKIKNLTDHDPNKKYLKMRSRNLNSKKITIFLSTHISNNEKIDLDRCLKKINLMRTGITYRKNIIYTRNEIILIIKKIKSFLYTLTQISNIIVLEK
ncbi:MAG: hypothetical protein VW380_02015 [Candidatus Woesearchaeota archaeon]